MPNADKLLAVSDRVDPAVELLKQLIQAVEQRSQDAVTIAHRWAHACRAVAEAAGERRGETWLRQAT